ncbi:uncharacterized protein LOC129742648 [Uranotaenia lowii]|uniref:uncharacterized protein LOC129742648 n=1 Tax=Uranotaenia lowii TaxID=190385 RepID=UPI0024789D9E|nr:uncharacterized protein LOC129742648 [Uranotaenia lowii]
MATSQSTPSTPMAITGSSVHSHDDKNTKEKRKDFISYEYQNTDNGPYRIFVELKQTGATNVSLNKFSLGAYLKSFDDIKGHVQELQYTGKDKIIIKINNYDKANKLVKLLNAGNGIYRAYVPKHAISISGVISGIPLDISDKEILDDIECEVPVMSVKRLSRKENEGTVLSTRELINWITQFLTNRKITLLADGKPVTRIISNGLPQGDVMSPTLFNIYTADLHASFPDDVSITQYVDDFNLIVGARNFETLKNKCQEVTDIFVNRAENLGFKVNSTKTKVMVFRRGQAQLQLKIKGETVETVRTQKYLGVTLDATLGFGAEARALRGKINDRMNMLKIICNIKVGSHPQTLTDIYIALIRSLIDYNATVFCNARKTNKKLLEVANNQCLRRVTGCTRTTPLNTLMAIAAQVPLEFRHEYICSKAIIRNLAHRTAVGLQLMALNNDENNENLSFMETTFLKYKSVFVLIMPFTDHEPLNVKIHDKLEGLSIAKKNTNTQRLKQLTLCAMNSKHAGKPKIFTDASKIDGTCGIGIYNEYYKQRYSLRLAHETSITEAEITAIEIALDNLRTSDIEFVLYTDSLSACTVLNNALNERMVPQQLHKILYLAHSKKVAIQWIPSHIGVIGNDIADNLAKLAITDPDSPSIDNLLCMNDTFLKIKRIKLKTTNDWYQEYVNAEGKGKTFYQIQDTFEERPWYYNVNLTNTEVRLLNRLQSGHDYSPFWKQKMKIIDDAECDLCLTLETSEHLLLHCPKFGTLRSSFDFDRRFANLTELFKSKNYEHYKQLCKFEKEAKLDL